MYPKFDIYFFITILSTPGKIKSYTFEIQLTIMKNMVKFSRLQGYFAEFSNEFSRFATNRRNRKRKNKRKKLKVKWDEKCVLLIGS